MCWSKEVWHMNMVDKTAVCIYSVSGKKWDQIVFFVISHIKLGRFWWNLMYSFLNKFARNNVNVFHLTWIMFYTALWNLKCLSRMCYHWVIKVRNSRIYSASGHSWGGINFSITFSDNAMVECAWWAFQVLQGSVKTLFRWGGKRLHDFAANLFRKLCTKFRQDHPSFVEDITRSI